MRAVVAVAADRRVASDDWSRAARRRARAWSSSGRADPRTCSMGSDRFDSGEALDSGRPRPLVVASLLGQVGENGGIPTLVSRIGGSTRAKRCLDSEAAVELIAEASGLAFEHWHRCKGASEAETRAWLFGITEPPCKLLSAKCGRTGCRSPARYRGPGPRRGQSGENGRTRGAGASTWRGGRAVQPALSGPTSCRALAGDELSYAEVADRLQVSG